MKVLMGFDDCGHAFAFDVSTPEQELIILEGMCKEAAKEGRLDPEEKTQVKEAIAKKDLEKIYEILDHADLLHLNARGCNSIVQVQSEWENGLGVMDL
jgi:hypothetical protein